MKVLLAITLLFAAVHSATIVKRLADMIGLSESNSTLVGARGLRHKRYAEKPDISLINEMRRAVANAGGIPNMKDLVWDEQLVAAAKDMNSDCEKLANGPNYRYFMEGPDENAQKMVAFYYSVLLVLDQVDNIPLTAEHRKMLRDLKNEFERNQDKYTFMLFELFNPAQTKIGCAQSRCDGVIPGSLQQLANAIGLNGLTYSFDIMCAIGPNRVWDKAELQTVEYAAKETDVMNKKSFMSSSGSSVGAQLVLLFSLLSLLM